MKIHGKTRNPTWKGLARALWVLGLLTLAAGAAPAQEEAEEHPGFLAAKGRVTFRVYCASCHGPKAVGDGNLAQYLTVEPSDLTQLSKNNDGEFPLELLVRIIDGRQKVRGHGTQDMPVWGDVFQSPLSEEMALPGESGEDRATRKIKELVFFLETIQKDAKPAKQAEEGGR